MKTRTDVLNHLIQKHHLKRYLEIGVQDAAQNFDKIICPEKIGVDPDPDAKATYCMTSDKYFNMAHAHMYHPDLIFIDGLHTAEQVKKDFENALKILSPNGFIVLHDCSPEKEEHTIVPRPTARGHWNGDVYKFAVTISNKRKYTVDVDNGCLVFNASGNILYQVDEFTRDVKWDYFDKHRNHLLNLITWEEFVSL
jgi:hypothetical protein